eukprot:1141288-Pelagomonas_calceolata.AAC.5
MPPWIVTHHITSHHTCYRSCYLSIARSYPPPIVAASQSPSALPLLSPSSFSLSTTDAGSLLRGTIVSVAVEKAWSWGTVAWAVLGYTRWEKKEVCCMRALLGPSLLLLFLLRSSATACQSQARSKTLDAGLAAE